MTQSIRRLKGARRIEMSDAWKTQVRAEMHRRGITMASLAQAIGVRTAAISLMLGPTQQTSRMVSAICEQLQIDPPYPEPSDPDYERVRRIKKLSKEAQAAIDLFIDLLERLPR